MGRKLPQNVLEKNLPLNVLLILEVILDKTWAQSE